MKPSTALVAIGLPVAATCLLLPTAAAAHTTLAPVTRFILRLRRDRAFRADWRHIEAHDPTPGNHSFIAVDIAREKLYLFKRGHRIAAWRVSTAIDGIGQRAGSRRTPVGVFRIARKIGAGLNLDAVLRGRVPTGAITPLVAQPDDPAASRPIIARILWLQGLQRGWNRGGDVSTFRRYIYIHGTPNVGMLGRPASHGCVQMSPWAVESLYRDVPTGTPVLITPGSGNLRHIPGPFFNKGAPATIASTETAANDNLQ